MNRRDLGESSYKGANGHSFDIEGARRRREARMRPRRWVSALVVTALVLQSAAAGVALWQRNQARDRLDDAARSAARLLALADAALAELAASPPRRDEAPGAGGEGGAVSALFDAAGGLLAKLDPAGERADAAERAQLLAQLWRAEEVWRGPVAGALVRYDAALAAAVALAGELARRSDAVSWPAAAQAHRLAGQAALRRGDAASALPLLVTAVDLEERRPAAQPSIEDALALAATRGLLAEAEAATGALDRSEQQRRLVLQLLEPWTRPPTADERARPVIALALAALGDLEVQRQRRGSARGYYDRAWAMVAPFELPLAEGDPAAPFAPAPSLARRRLLIDLGLRRLRQQLAGAEHCLPLLRHEVALLTLDDPADWWRFDQLLEVCPRLPATTYEVTRALAEQLAAIHPQQRVALGLLHLALAEGLMDAARWQDAAAELAEGSRLLEAVGMPASARRAPAATASDPRDPPLAGADRWSPRRGRPSLVPSGHRIAPDRDSLRESNASPSDPAEPDLEGRFLRAQRRYSNHSSISPLPLAPSRPRRPATLQRRPRHLHARQASPPSVRCGDGLAEGSRRRRRRSSCPRPR